MVDGLVASMAHVKVAMSALQKAVLMVERTATFSAVSKAA